MGWLRLGKLFRGRFAPSEYLGLHLTIGLMLSLFLLAVFIVITHDIHEEGGHLARFDMRMADQLEQHAATHPLLLSILRAITYAGGFFVMVLLTVAGGLVLLARGHRLLATVWLLSAITGALIDQLLKIAIDRHRPANADVCVTQTNPSFPSGHSMASVVGYGMLAYFALVRLRRRWLRRAIVAALTVLVLLIGFSRVYLRAHYFSDVIGGYCIGVVWLAVCVSGMEAIRRRRQPVDPSTTGAHERSSVDYPPSPEKRDEREGV
jgi:undecaprenyl-diphosphatase